jgi:hypothetical protein
MIAVKATREGLQGGKTSSGYRVDPIVPFVALPSTAALRLWVKVHNPRNGREAPVHRAAARSRAAIGGVSRRATS